MILNEVLEKLPKHLMSLVIDQPYNEYTSQDHAVWRYVMRQNVEYLSKVAHGSYLEGLKKTGISINEIPHMYGMNRILKEIGWAAVAVDGFIPPAAFMEFQAYNVLVIAADIRPINQIEYTPAPDIIHEAAGHAPIIADPDYADYLRKFGEIGAKAFSSAADYRQYEAIRHLSILKANPYTPKEKIRDAELRLEKIDQEIGEPSEMSRIRNLHWWTVEYGLIGDLRKPKIYGAGLLSSIGESFSCLKDEVAKLPYSIDAVNYNFDITTRQPQLFVTPDFEYLTEVLNRFANRMALKRGGLYGINQAIDSENVATAVYSSGLQVSGIFSDVTAICDDPVYLLTNSPTQLAFDNRELKDHNKTYHQHGFGSPVGHFKSSQIPPELLSENELAEIGILAGERCKIEFVSGITVEGFLKKILNKEGNNLLFSFEDCLVKHNETVLFEPSWGTYDMAVGQLITSVHSGPADANAFELTFAVPQEKTQKIEHNDKARRLHGFYSNVRKLREHGFITSDLKLIWQKIKTDFPDEWLIILELLELTQKSTDATDLTNELTGYLLQKIENRPQLSTLISNGLNLLNKKNNN
jgi:phenylalanine-4-hydroxylase